MIATITMIHGAKCNCQSFEIKKNQVDKSDKKVKFQFNEKHSMINEKIFTFH